MARRRFTAHCRAGRYTGPSNAAEATVDPSFSCVIGQDLRHERIEWGVERVAWWLFVAIVLAALAGLFGKGPLSDATVRSAGVEVEYDRFQREDTPFDYRLRIDPALARDGHLAVHVDRTLVDMMDIERIQPEPDTARVGPAATDYAFATRPGHGPLHIVFHYRPHAMGRYAGRIRVEGAAPVVLRQLVYP